MVRFIPSLAAAPEDPPMTHLAAWSACTRSWAVRCTDAGEERWMLPNRVPACSGIGIPAMIGHDCESL